MVSVIKPKQFCALDQSGRKASADLTRTKAVAHDRGGSHALDRLYAATVLTERRAGSVQHLAIGSVEEERRPAVTFANSYAPAVARRRKRLILE